MSYILKKTVAMVGMMGAGKTAVGIAVAKKLEVPFRDSDAEIELASQRQISEIFATHGEAYFREKEAQVIERLLKGQASIVSTGGGAYLVEKNRDAIAQSGVAVWINAEIDVLWARVRHKDTRPLLRTANPRATLEALFHARVPIYEGAQIHVESRADRSISAMADLVISALLTRPDVLEYKK